MSLKGRTLITPPAAEPISLSEAKLHLREDGSGQDALITALIVAARQWAEETSWRAMVTQTWDFSMDRFPLSRELWVPKPPLQSVTHVKYIDDFGDEQTLASSKYLVDTATQPGRVRLDPDASWPVTGDYPAAVTVRAVIGYGNAAAVPDRIKQGMLLAIGHWYANRESVVVGSIATQVPMAARALVDLDSARVIA